MGETFPIRLVDEPPFALGAVAVDPATRTLTGAGQILTIEPRTMQVLVTLARRRDEVVGRQTLIDACWEGRIVGEDAINRAILKLRRALDESGGSIIVETVARVGYKLSVVGETNDRAPASVNRRWMLGGGVVAAAAIASGGYFAWPRGPERSKRAQELYERGEVAFQQGLRDDNAQAVGFFEQAAALAPEDPSVAGALALAYRFEQTFRGPTVLAQSTAKADRATAHALALDSSNPDAIAAQSLYVPFRNHWLETERRLRAGLRLVPDSGVMNGFLGKVLAGVGRTRAAIVELERSVGGARFVPLLRGDLIQALFAAERLGDVDRELDAAAALWPRFVALWWLRFWTYAYTGRLDAALAHIEAKPGIPLEITSDELDAAQQALRALGNRSPATAQDALSGWDKVTRRIPSAWPTQIGLAAHLGQIDEAMQMTRRYLTPLIEKSAGPMPATTFLFSAPLAPLRQHPSFWSICERVGLADYWQKSGSRPDVWPKH
jgi:DNA-binding winged helix-turn-helix (wHTH) protein